MGTLDPGYTKTYRVASMFHSFKPNKPLGALMSISEMQCRLLVSTWTGKLKPLPSAETMEIEIQRHKDKMVQRHGEAARHTIQVDYVPYCDQMAKALGCYPGWKALIEKYGFMEGLRLWSECLWGPACPVQYRLVGPGQWAGAREAVWAYAKKGPAPTYPS
ncbi:hypothetical protein DFQ26_004471 [Actinomortierella ambigua]|nr:hypothetical protein DFQ26_004471 [Actinomortierella ambigua]